MFEVMEMRFYVKLKIFAFVVYLKAIRNMQCNKTFFTFISTFTPFILFLAYHTPSLRFLFFGVEGMAFTKCPES